MKIEGTYTALITPFKGSGELDEESFVDLARLQAQAGNHLVPCGTTGESPTLDHAEHVRVIKMAVDVAREYQGIQVMAGIGSNNTKEAIKLAEEALMLGADAGLSVIPYYNKPGQEGNYQHQLAVAQVGLPLVIYNIPGRCGGPGLTPATILRMAEHENIIGLKAAAGVNDDLSEVLMKRPRDFSVLSGDDTLTFYMMAMGAEGVVSVTSNAFPGRVHGFVDGMLKEEHVHGRFLNASLFPLFKACMSYGTNPEAIKEMVYLRRVWLHMPHYEPHLRLPMMRLPEEQRKNLATIVQDSI
jgi:4-hydroxy-tetrahydrodipicolinate synthase